MIMIYGTARYKLPDLSEVERMEIRKRKCKIPSGTQRFPYGGNSY
jgi:hypothetical protein